MASSYPHLFFQYTYMYMAKAGSWQEIFATIRLCEHCRNFSHMNKCWFIVFLTSLYTCYSKYWCLRYHKFNCILWWHCTSFDTDITYVIYYLLHVEYLHPETLFVLNDHQKFGNLENISTLVSFNNLTIGGNFYFN